MRGLVRQAQYQEPARAIQLIVVLSYRILCQSSVIKTQSQNIMVRDYTKITISILFG